MSAFTATGGILNAFIATTANNPIILASIDEMRSWYGSPAMQHETSIGEVMMGPVTLYRAVKHFAAKTCQVMDFEAKSEVQWQCGDEGIRLYHETAIECHGQARHPKCSPRRADSSFVGLRFALVDPSATS